MAHFSLTPRAKFYQYVRLLGAHDPGSHLKAEKQHDINMRIYYARLERWARESRSKKPPRPSLVLKRVDKNTAFEHESVVNVMAVRYVAMEARAMLAEAVGKADDARILILKRRVRQLLKCQKSQPRARKARAEK